MTAEPDDPFERIAHWRALGQAVALATVVRTWGSSPRPAGSHLAVEEGGAFVGSVSGGCIEGATVAQALESIADGKPRLLEFGVSDARAWEVGLACGGRVQVYVERIDERVDRLLAARREKRPVALVTRLVDGAQALVGGEASDGALALSPALLDEVRGRIAAERSGPLEADDGLFARIYAPPPRLLVVGAVHIAQALVPMARLAGFAVTVIDPRRSFASAERFPEADLTGDWPDEAMARLAPDAHTAVVTLSHDPKLDDPALIAALGSPAFYVGALGSRRTHVQRLQRLQEAGLESQSGRIRAPVGLDLGGRSPAEIAVSILAEIVQCRYRPKRPSSRE
jgi:xanthine dehydrogenase accessory factor